MSSYIEMKMMCGPRNMQLNFEFFFHQLLGLLERIFWAFAAEAQHRVRKDTHVCFQLFDNMVMYKRTRSLWRQIPLNCVIFEHLLILQTVDLVLRMENICWISETSVFRRTRKF